MSDVERQSALDQAPTESVAIGTPHTSAAGRPGGAKGLPPTAAVGLLIAMTVAVYLPALAADFIWDDETYIINNPHLRSLDGLRRIWFHLGATPQYYPLVHTAFWFEYHLWGLAPLGYHVVNVALQAVNAVLVWRLLARLKVPGAWLAAAIFAVHPICVESVAWVTERKNVLSLALALSSMLCYLRFAPLDDEAGETAAPSPRRWRWYGPALVLFALALFAKTVVFSMPAVLLVLCWWKRGRIGWRDLLPLAPFFVLGVAMGSLTAWMEVEHVSARGAEWDMSPLARVLLAGRVVWFYAGKVFWPYPLAFFYPRWTIDPGAWWQYLFPVAAVALIVGLWLSRKRIGRGPLAAALIFGGVLVPAMGFFNVYPFRFSYVADHFQYHASISLLALAVAAATGIVAQLASLLRNAVRIAVPAGLLLVLGALAFQQARVYHNLETLYRDTIAKNPGGWTAYSNLSVYLQERRRPDEALELARKALELNPADPLIHNNLASLLIEVGERGGFRPGQREEAIDHYREAIRLMPEYHDAHNNMALMLIEDNRPAEAMEHFATVLERFPNYAFSQHGMGILLWEAGRKSEALPHLAKTIELTPTSAEGRHARAILLWERGRLEEALGQLRETLVLNPARLDALCHSADLLAREGRPEQALDAYAQVVRRRPKYFRAQKGMANVLLQLGQVDRAVQQLNQLLALQPDDVEAQQALERALESQLKGRK
ncbi:MAG: tetratricopeptide repeat protein [Planctomycetia bacterium]|nr:tetratricopeptide repeat protein [Planctomycetia bacterium]